MLLHDEDIAVDHEAGGIHAIASSPQRFPISSSLHRIAPRRASPT
jgi:hypothetical protein